MDFGRDTLRSEGWVRVRSKVRVIGGVRARGGGAVTEWAKVGMRPWLCATNNISFA